MFLRKYIIPLLLFGFISADLAAQKKSSESGGFIYRRASTVGVKLHSNGWGIEADFYKTNDIFKQKFYRFEIINIRHSKEKKQQPGFSRDITRPYVFGKINSFLAVNATTGRKMMLGEKGRKNGVELSWNYSYGVSLGLLKPYYLLVVKENELLEEIPYSAEEAGIFLNRGRIIGRGRSLLGLDKIKLRPGLTFKTGVTVDYAVFDEFIQAIEAGIQINAYLQRTELMLTETNQFIHPNLYVKLSLGRRFYN